MRQAIGEPPPYETAGDLASDLVILHHSLIANGGELLARGRLRNLRRAVNLFGRHLAALDLRQNSEVHERTVAELIQAAGRDGYQNLSQEQRIEARRGELATSRPLVSPFVAYSAETASEIALLRGAFDAHLKPSWPR